MSTRLQRFSQIALVLIVLSMPVGTFWPIAAQSGQGGSRITVSLMPYEGNPILGPDGAQAWERDGWWNPSVIFDGDSFHMFYIGFRGTTSHVGYAKSDDGLTWNRYESNPVFVPDETVAPAGGVQHTKAYLDGDTWVLLFVPALQPYKFSEIVLRATASTPTGPWTVDAEPVLRAGESAEWDSGGIYVHSVLAADNGDVLYYSPANPGGCIGMATSPDGIHWTKYDDPVTTDSRHASSDPVFEKNADSKAWDSMIVAGSMVRRAESGWEMFYAGTHSSIESYSVGYATSEDGIDWIREGDAPVLTRAGGTAPDSLVVIDDTYFLYYAYAVNQTIGIGVATGTVTRE